LALPGMLHACLVLSVHAHARIRRIDTGAALAHPNVVAVVTAADLPPSARDDAPADRTRFFLAAERVSHVGQPVAAVLAENAADAELAADLVQVDWEPIEPIVDPVAALAPGAAPVRPQG